MGRPLTFDRPMTAVERQRRRRARAQEQREPIAVLGDGFAVLNRLERLPPDEAWPVIEELTRRLARIRRLKRRWVRKLELARADEVIE